MIAILPQGNVIPCKNYNTNLFFFPTPARQTGSSARMHNTHNCEFGQGSLLLVFYVQSSKTMLRRISNLNKSNISLYISSSRRDIHV